METGPSILLLHGKGVRAWTRVIFFAVKLYNRRSTGVQRLRGPGFQSVIKLHYSTISRLGKQF
jgi:hypothetical protein